MKINKNTSVLKILQEYPKLDQIFSDYGLGCSRCLAANYEDLETVARANQINVEVLLEELNDSIDIK